MTMISSNQRILRRGYRINYRVYTPVAVFSSALADDSLDGLRLYLILDSYRIKPTVMRAPAQWAPAGRSGRRRWSRRLRTRWPWWWSMRPWLGHMLGGTEHWAQSGGGQGSPAPWGHWAHTADNQILRANTQPWPLFMSSLIRQNYFIRSRYVLTRQNATVCVTILFWFSFFSVHIYLSEGICFQNTGLWFIST